MIRSLTLTLGWAALQGNLRMREVSMSRRVKSSWRGGVHMRCSALDRGSASDAETGSLEREGGAPATAVCRHVDAEGSACRSSAGLSPVSLGSGFRGDTKQ